jgi:hypothetical protein
MEQFSRECLEIDSEPVGGHPHAHAAHGKREPRDDEPGDGVEHARDPPDLMGPASSMDTVYDRAAKLVQRTLDVEGVVVMDVSHYEVLETMSAEGTVSVVLHHGDPDVPTSTRTLSVEEYGRLNEFFARYPEGKICEGIVPPTFRLFLPQAHIQYALSESRVRIGTSRTLIGRGTVVPIYNIDKRPFALLCAWNASDQTKRFVSALLL